MAKQSKLTLLLELKKKLFSNKLIQARQKLRKTTQRMKGDLHSLKAKAKEVFGSIKNELPALGRAFDLLGNPFILIIAGITSLGVVMATATQQAKAFNKEFRQIQNLNFDKSGASLQAYKSKIRDAAFEMGTDLKDSTIAFYDLQSATGLYGEKAEMVFKKVAKYTIATGANLNESVNATTKAMQAFGLGVNDIDQYLTSNAKTVAAGITTYAALAKIQTEFAGSAAAAGQSVDTANKLFAVFTKMTGSASMAATETKTAFEGITQASTIKGLKALGISLYTAQGEMRGLENILADVQTRFEDLTPQQIDAIINKIGGPEGLRKMFNKLKTDAGGFKQTLEAFNNSSFNLDKAFKNAKNNITEASSEMKNKFNTLMARLGDRLIPLAVYGLKSMMSILDSIYKNFDSIMEVVESIAIGAAVFGGLKLALIGASIAAGGLTGVLGSVKFALFAIRFAIYNIPIVGWIAAAVTGLVLLYKKWDGFRAVVDASWAVIKAFLKNMWEGIKTTVSGMVATVSGAFKLIKAVVSWDFVGAKEGLEQMKSGVKDVISGSTSAVPLTSAIKHYKTYGKVAANEFNASLNRSKAKAKKEEESDLGKFSPGAGGSTDEGSESGSGIGSQIANVASGGSGGGQHVVFNIESAVKIDTINQVSSSEGSVIDQLEEQMTEVFQRMIANLRTT